MIDHGQLWSLCLTAAGISNSFLVIKKLAFAWLTALSIEVAWFAYAIVSDQWPFAISAIFFCSRDIYGYLKWRRDAQEVTECTCRATSLV